MFLLVGRSALKTASCVIPVKRCDYMQIAQLVVLDIFAVLANLAVAPR